MSTSVKTIVEERFEKDKHDKEKDKHDKEKDKHERRMVRRALTENFENSFDTNLSSFRAAKQSDQNVSRVLKAHGPRCYQIRWQGWARLLLRSSFRSTSTQSRVGISRPI